MSICLCNQERLIYTQHTKDKIDPDYHVTTVIGPGDQNHDIKVADVIEC